MPMSGSRRRPSEPRESSDPGESIEPRESIESRRGRSLLIVEGDDRQTVTVDVSRWVSLMTRALEHEGVPANAEASLSFVDIDEMTVLNQQHMGGTGPTDVLAFPLDGLGAGDGSSEDASSGIPVMVGDVVICPEVADRATGPERSLDEELALLVVHGSLHLLGHDHAEPQEKATMQARESLLLKEFFA